MPQRFADWKPADDPIEKRAGIAGKVGKQGRDFLPPRFLAAVSTGRSAQRRTAFGDADRAAILALRDRVPYRCRIGIPDLLGLHVPGNSLLPDRPAERSRQSLNLQEFRIHGSG